MVKQLQQLLPFSSSLLLLEVFLFLFLRGHDHPPRHARRAALRQEVRRHLGEVPQGTAAGELNGVGP